MEEELKYPAQNRYRSYPTLLKLVCNASLSAFNFGFINVHFNSIDYEDIVRIFALEQYPKAFMQGLLTACLSFTGGIGAFLSSYIFKKFSRIQCYQIIGISTIITCFLMLMGNLTMLLIGRLVSGMVIGMTTALNPLYVRQFVPTQLAAKLCPYIQVLVVAGTTYGFLQTYLLSLFLPVEVYWRIVFGFPVLVSCVMLYNLQTKYPYQTPKWLLLNNKDTEAKQVLSFIYYEPYSQLVYEELKYSIKSQKKNQPQSNNIELQETQQGLISKQKIQQSKVQLSSNKLAIISVFVLALNQQILGMGVIIAYSGELTKSCFPSLSKIFPTFVNAIALAGVFASFPVLQAFGRKNSIQYGNIIIIICLFCTARCFGSLDFSLPLDQNSSFIKILMMSLLLAIRLFFSVTLGSIVWIYNSEVVQAQILPYAIFQTWMVIAIVNLTFPIQKEWLGGNPEHIFDFYWVMTIICYLINRYAMIETADKSEMEIRREYDEKWN